MRCALLVLVLVLGGCADEPTATDHFKELESSTMRDCGILRPHLACSDDERAKLESAIGCIADAMAANVVASLDAYEPQDSWGAFATYYFAVDGAIVTFSSYDDFTSGETSLNEGRCSRLEVKADFMYPACSRIACLD